MVHMLWRFIVTDLDSSALQLHDIGSEIQTFFVISNNLDPDFTLMGLKNSIADLIVCYGEYANTNAMSS